MVNIPTQRQPLVPLTEEQREKVRSSDRWVILARVPGENSYQGYVENSFCMDWSKDRVLQFNMVWGDGKANGEEHLSTARNNHPSWEIEMYHWRDENLPVILDIESWLDDLAHNPNTLSGVSDKFKARNIPFTMK
ncbi:hypothetical protein EVB87_025 [Rhizobium phage RHph_N28_1]|nr:hypothetical protein EVB87_025 [Rhizobium phage RHph_N28_1]QIG74053.1 hypothetical protein EVC07_025 [Rhizobium phage RHph_N42]